MSQNIKLDNKLLNNFICYVVYLKNILDRTGNYYFFKYNSC